MADAIVYASLVFFVSLGILIFGVIISSYKSVNRRAIGILFTVIGSVELILWYTYIHSNVFGIIYLATVLLGVISLLVSKYTKN